MSLTDTQIYRLEMSKDPDVAAVLDEVAALRAEVERLRGLILDAEYLAGGFNMEPAKCPWCDAYGRHPHRDDCPAFSSRGAVRR